MGDHDEYVNGQLSALRIIIAGMLSTFPSSARLQAEKLLESQIAAALGQGVSDPHLQAMHDIAAWLQRTPRRPLFRRPGIDAIPLDPR